MAGCRGCRGGTAAGGKGKEVADGEREIEAWRQRRVSYYHCRHCHALSRHTHHTHTHTVTYQGGIDVLGMS